MTWGYLELIHVISLMWQLKISILDFGGGTKNIVTWYFGHQKNNKRGTCSTPLQWINSFHWNRYFFLYWGHVTLFTLYSLINLLPNSLESYQTFFFSSKPLY